MTTALQIEELESYHQDGLGSVVGVSDQTGATTTARYDAWGNATATGPIPLYGYTGREPDETGLVYYRARYYDPSTGRFTQKDPIGMNGGMNLYAYAINNPTNFSDPMGTSVLDSRFNLQTTVQTNYFNANGLDSTGSSSAGSMGFSSAQQSLAVVGSTSATAISTSLPGFQAVTDLLTAVPSYVGTALGYLGTVITPPVGVGLAVIGGFIIGTETTLSDPEISSTYFAEGSSVGEASRVHSPDQQAVIELAKGAKQTGEISRQDAETLVNWADEYGIPAHGPMTHPARGDTEGFGSTTEHIRVGPERHIPVR